MNRDLMFHDAVILLAIGLLLNNRTLTITASALFIAVWVLELRRHRR